MSEYTPEVGDRYAGMVRDRRFVDERAPATEVVVTKSGCGAGCPESYKGVHVHVGTGARKLRPRTILLRRFDTSGDVWAREDVWKSGAQGRYYLVERAER